MISRISRPLSGFARPAGAWRHASASSLAHVLIGEPASTSPEHALKHGHESAPADGFPGLCRRPARRRRACGLERGDQARARSARHHGADRGRGGRGRGADPRRRGPAGRACAALGDRLGDRPSRLFRRPDRGLPGGRHEPSLSDRARLGAAPDRAGQHDMARRAARPARLGRPPVPGRRRDDAVAARRRRARPARPPRGRLCAVHRADGLRLFGDRRRRRARRRQCARLHGRGLSRQRRDHGAVRPGAPRRKAARRPVAALAHRARRAARCSSAHTASRCGR